YAAERSGAPVQAFCRYDPEGVTNRNLIYEPDHVVVLDPTLVGPAILGGLRPGGWILLNVPDPPDAYTGRFPVNRVATVDATAIARAHELGTRSVPIVNTALLGALGRILAFSLEDVEAALDHLGFGGGNVLAAREAFDAVLTREPEEAVEGGGEKVAPAPRAPRGPSFLDGYGGELPGTRTGQWATEQPRRQQFVPPCNHVCPAGNDVQGFLHALAEERTDDALAILLGTTPFPAVCGRVCPAPCMASCNRIELDGAVNVRQLERFAGDRGRALPTRLGEREEKVAVVGSGPGGLTAAYHLVRFGYEVTVYEAGAEAGGLLRTGIPGFRLPEAVLDREVARIVDLGVEIVTGHPVDRAGLLDLSRSHDAVVVATGLQELRGLRVGLDGVEAVEQGIVFLDRIRHEDARLEGEDVVVVGGGNTALDAARSSLRLGAASVRVVYRRGRQEMPAIDEEVEEGVEEGVDLLLLAQPVAVRNGPSANGGRSRHVLVCRRMELGEPDESGRRRPVEVPGSDFDLTCDRVILALGQSPDLSVFPEGTEVREGEELLGLLETPVYAVGDLATNDGTVAGAIGSGRRTAFHVHTTLSGEAVEPGEHHQLRADVDVWHDEVIRPGALRMHLFERTPSWEGATTPMAFRRTTFEEVHEGLTDASEAQRCLSCGVCNECDLCVTFCPEGVLKRVGHDLVFDYAYCKGCGICVTECPRNVVFMSHL
ncbi:MAG TPA: FAD-dependent oxidoreductase, partial [Longimicrobiales bacterium]|nr:FAD-dependent oxidoreductase [Longimicrobiales bacterium]